MMKERKLVKSMLSFLLIVAFMLPNFLVDGFAAGDAYTVDGGATYATLQEAFDAITVSGSHTITVSENVSNEATTGVLNAPGAQVTLQSEGADAYTITSTAAMNARHILVEEGSLTLENIILDGSDNAGGIKAEGANSSLTIGDKAIITNCYSGTEPGGGVSAIDGEFYLLAGGKITKNKTDTSVATSGGGVYLKNAAGKMSGGIISENEAPFGAGIMIAIDSEFEMSDGEITGNKAVVSSAGASGYGGGVQVEGDKQTGEISFKMTGGSITQNNAAQGGGIYIGQGSYVAAPVSEERDQASVQLTNGTISGNTATTYGGGICVMSNGLLDMQDGTIEDNTAGYGGGIFGGNPKEARNSRNKMIPVAEIRITGGTITNNNAVGTAIPFGGGGISFIPLDASNASVPMNLSIENATITNNTSAARGGGIYIFDQYNSNAAQETTYIIKNSTISNNKAQFNGGGITGQARVQLEVTNCVIEYNVAARNGGGIIMDTQKLTNPAATGATLKLNNSKIANNESKIYGGGLYVYNNTSMFINDSEFTANKALSGGGMYLENRTGTSPTTTASISNTKILDNIASFQTGATTNGTGGGVYLGTTAALDFDSVIFKGNQSEGNGGGIYVASNSSYRKHAFSGDTSFEENTAGGDGGAIFTNDLDYNDPIPTTKYQNIVFNAPVTFAKNTANGLYKPASNANTTDFPNIQFAGTSIPSTAPGYITSVSAHPFNNYDINYKNPPVYYNVTYIPGTTETVTNIPASELQPEGNQVSISATIPSRDGYTFIGWETVDVAGITDFDYAENGFDPTGFTMPAKNVVLIAKWIRKTYTVTYEPNGGAGTAHIVSENVGTAHNILANSHTSLGYTYSGYTFLGWSEVATAPTATYTGAGLETIGENAAADSNIVLYAIWKKNSSGGPSGNGNKPSAELIKVDSKDENTKLSGAKFALYKENSSGEDAKIGIYTTDNNGQILVENLTAGTYYWIETASPEGYKLDETKHTFKLGSNGKETTTVKNEKAKVPELLNGDDHYAYIIGYTDGSVRPEANISRAEVGTIFFRLLKDDIRNKNLTKINDFSDVTSDKWFNQNISTIASMNIIKGYSDGTFKPQNYITRAEFAAIAARFDTDATASTTSFTDVAGHWAEKEIAIAVENGWVNGYQDGTFRPDNYITRAEAVSLINRVLQRLPENENDLLDSMVKWPDNAEVNAWYYIAIQEATNSHYYNRKLNDYEKWTTLRENRDWAAEYE